MNELESFKGAFYHQNAISKHLCAILSEQSRLEDKVASLLIILEEKEKENAQLKSELKKAHEDWDVLAVENLELT
jgi:hypothetical protein